MKKSTVLAFTIGRARLALPIEKVREILPMLELVRPPETPALLRGFVNLGGDLVPVLHMEALLQLNLQGTDWRPERDADSVIILANLDGSLVAWMAAPSTEILNYRADELARLPKDHVLNNCAEYVIARQPPEPSIVLLAASRLLLEAERRRLDQLTRREQERLAAI